MRICHWSLAAKLESRSPFTGVSLGVQSIRGTYMMFKPDLLWEILDVLKISENQKFIGYHCRKKCN